MAYREMGFGLRNQGNMFSMIRDQIAASAFSAVQGNEQFDDFASQFELNQVQGVESMTLKGMLHERLSTRNYNAFHGAMNRASVSQSDMEDIVARTEDFYKTVGGLEGFSMQNFKGSEADIKAANMTLNAQSHLQTAAAEALFATVTVKYEDEGASLTVRAAGLGTYAYGNTAWQQASDLKPIFGQLRTGEMFKDEVLAIYPVYPDDANDDTRELFVDAGVVSPWGATYPENDAYGRENHDTSYLKVPGNIPNFLGLCQAPGQRAWTATDEIESNSIMVEAIQVSGKLGTTDVTFFINTRSISNNTFITSTNIQSSDDRRLNIYLNRFKGFSVLDKDGKNIGDTLFKSFKDAGFEPLLDITLTGNFQRQKNTLTLNAGQVGVIALEEITTGNTIDRGRANDQQKALLKSLTGGMVNGARVRANVNNISRGNFGYRIEVFDTIKHLPIHRGSPVSVKYPISKDDVNQGSLDYAISQMSVAINNQCSKKAFDMAQEHLQYITSIDGYPVVSNNQGSNVLPGMHYVQASAINRKISLKESVSTVDSTGIFEAVSAVFTNELSDITAALATKSGIMAIAEYGGTVAPKWNIIVHQNLARFLMHLGDARTLGAGVGMKAVETNFTSQIGQILIVTENDSTSDYINPLGGIGVMVSKENIVVQGNVTRDQQDFGVVMTMPTYKHWALNPIIGSLVIEDAHEFLGDEGLLTKLGKQKVEVLGLAEGLKAIADAQAPVTP